jgi:hypothetical protein
MDDYKNALPKEVTESIESDVPQPLHTVADKLPPLNRPEADVAGISPTPATVYGENTTQPNSDDQRDAHGGSEP